MDKNSTMTYIMPKIDATIHNKITSRRPSMQARKRQCAPQLQPILLEKVRGFSEHSLSESRLGFSMFQLCWPQLECTFEHIICNHDRSNKQSPFNASDTLRPCKEKTLCKANPIARHRQGGALLLGWPTIYVYHALNVSEVLAMAIRVSYGYSADLNL